MSGVLNLLLAGAAAAVKDAYFNLTTLLLNTSSTNGAQNNTFLDSSTNNFTITRNGNTTQGTFTPFSQTGWSNYTSAAASNYINFTTSPGTLFQFSGDFTIEAWIYPTLLGTGESLWVSNDGGSTYLAFNITTTNYDIYLNSSSVTSSIAHGINLNQWNHCAMVRSGSTVTIYTNGVSKGTITNSSTLGYANPPINRNGGGGSAASWYMSNLRIVKSAVYTSAFTPQTTPLTNIANTSLLTCQSNRFIDNSSNALVATVTGTPSVQAFSPFAPTAAYDTAVVGGSGYFDGSGDYLTTGSSANLAIGTNDFCIEWFYYPNTSSDATPFCQWGGGANDWILQFNSGNFIFYYASTSISYTYTPIPNQWIHACVCRSGSTMSLYLNGTRVNTKTDTTSIPNTRGIVVGVNPDGAGQNCNGYIAYPRLVVGNSVYTPSSTTLTVPTAPLTAVTGTKFLVGMTNAGIYDSASKNVLETVGNAQVSTTQAKFGTTSMGFDGTGDNLKLKLTNAIGGGDYTIEGFFYASGTGIQYLFDIRETSQYIGAYIIGSSTTLYVNFGTTLDIVASSSFTLNSWNHLAFVRSGSGTNNTSVFLNGSRVYQRTDTTNYSIVPNLFVSCENSGNYYLNGYVDEFRITKGYARYSGATYTVPTAAFPLQ